MTRSRHLGCVLALSTAFFPAAPVPAQILTDERVWWNATVQKRSGTPSPWRWYFEVQGRMRDGIDALDQLLVRPAVGYDLTSRSSVWLGYGYTPGFPASGGTLTEHRSYQQHLWSASFSKHQVGLRSRLEQRDIEGNDGLAWRFRHQARVTRTVKPGRLTASVSNELLFHLNTTRRTAAGFDQNRIFGGLGVILKPSARIEAGYLHQYINSLSGPNRSNHVASIVLNLTY